MYVFIAHHASQRIERGPMADHGDLLQAVEHMVEFLPLPCLTLGPSADTCAPLLSRMDLFLSRPSSRVWSFSHCITPSMYSHHFLLQNSLEVRVGMSSLCCSRSSSFSMTASPTFSIVPRPPLGFSKPPHHFPGQLPALHSGSCWSWLLPKILFPNTQLSFLLPSS